MNLPSTTVSMPPFEPHGSGYFWRPDILWLHVGANTLIAFAYIVIPITLVVIIRKTKYDIPHRDLIYLFVTFIGFCGLSHAIEIITTWYPYYLLEGWIKATTASVSMTTALILLAKVPDIIKTEATFEKLKKAENELLALEARINQMSSVYQASLGRENRITQLKVEVNKELEKQGLEHRYTVYEGNR